MTNGQGTTQPAVMAYIAAVRDELGDLPVAEATDIIEDVREHVTQVAQEYADDVGLAVLLERLGSPATYVAELRAAAGIAAPAAAPERAGFGRRLLRVMASVFGAAAVAFAVIAVVDAVFSVSGAPALFGVPAVISFVLAGASVLFLVLWHDDPAGELRQLPGAAWVDERVQQLRTTSWGPAAIEFVTSLRPGWWLARAAVLGVLVAYLVSAPLGAVTFVLALLASIRLGRATAAGRMPGRRIVAVYGVNAAIVAGGVFGVLAMADDVRLNPVFVDQAAEVSAYAGQGVYVNDDGAGFVTPDGMPVTNIYAYDADGALIDHVRLYDQNGRPLVLAESEPCYEGAMPDQTFVAANPWGTNVYPRFMAEADQSGQCHEAAPEPPFGPHLPTGDGDGLATPSPSGDPSPAPSPSPTGKGSP